MLNPISMRNGAKQREQCSFIDRLNTVKMTVSRCNARTRKTCIVYDRVDQSKVKWHLFTFTLGASRSWDSMAGQALKLPFAPASHAWSLLEETSCNDSDQHQLGKARDASM